MSITVPTETAIAWAKQSQQDEILPVLQALAERHPAQLFEDALRALKEPGQEEEEAIKPMLVGEFLAKIGTPPAMLVDRLVPDRGLVLVSGKPKHAKSFLAIDILDSVCRGQKVFGALSISRSGPVLYLGMEDGPYEIANRLLQRGIKAGDGRNLWIVTGRMDLSNSRNIVALGTIIDQVEPILIVIDTAREGCGVKDWSDAAEVTDKIRPLRQIARDRCSIILVAHNRKSEGINGDEISGSNALTSSVDGWISVQRKETRPDTGNLRLYASTDGRAAMRGDMALEMDTHDLHFKLLSDEELEMEKSAERQERRSSREDEVLRAIAEKGGKATAQQIADAVGMEYRNSKYFLNEMLGKGLIVDSGETAGTTRKAILWAAAS